MNFAGMAQLRLDSAVCQQKTELLSVYREATQVYADAVAKLQRVIGTSSRGEYERLYHVTEASRTDAAAAQTKLEKHIADHRC